MRSKVVHQYQILRKLGAGGVVYYARDTTLLRPVVLKMLRMPKGTGDSAPEKVLREARIASSIEHPNVCAIYEGGNSTATVSLSCSMCRDGHWRS